MREADDADRVAPRGTGAGNIIMELIYFEASAERLVRLGPSRRVVTLLNS